MTRNLRALCRWPSARGGGALGILATDRHRSAPMITGTSGASLRICVDPCESVAQQFRGARTADKH